MLTDRSGVADIADIARRWGAAPDISARSVLVTVLGDSILPVTKTVWLSSLFELVSPFGFNERLVRTSMFRLAAEGWVSNERVGRRSRYSLTLLAVSEFDDANRRIYARRPVEWDGAWTFAVVDTPRLSAMERDTILQRLGWHGFVTLGRGLLASPSVSEATLREILESISPSAAVPIGRAEIADIEGLVDDGFFATAFRTAQTEKAYREFNARYARWQQPESVSATLLAPVDAFALRIMLIHDLRRIRLRAPDVPPRLLPSDWIGSRAQELAADIYRRLSPLASASLGDILEVDYPATMPHRFENRSR